MPGGIGEYAGGGRGGRAHERPRQLRRTLAADPRPYTILDALTGNPVVRLNLAVAAAMVDGPTAGLGSSTSRRLWAGLARSHRLHAVRGHLLEQTGDSEAARSAYVAAAARTDNLRERDYLAMRAAALEDRVR